MSPEKLRGEISAKQPQWLTDAIAVVVHAERGQVKVIEEVLGLPERTFYPYADINSPKRLPAAWIPDICRVTGRFTILDALEAQVGRVAFALPRVNPDATVMNQELARSVTAFGEFLKENGDVLADGRIEPHEVKPLVSSIDQMIADLSEYRALVLEKAGRDAS